MSPSWDSTKAVAPGPEKLKWRSCPKTQEICGFRQLSQLGVVAIFPPNKGELSHLGVVAQTRIKPSFFGNLAIYFIQVGAWQLGRLPSLPLSSPEAAFLFPRFLL